MIIVYTLRLVTPEPIATVSNCSSIKLVNHAHMFCDLFRTAEEKNCFSVYLVNQSSFKVCFIISLGILILGYCGKSAIGT